MLQLKQMIFLLLCLTGMATTLRAQTWNGSGTESDPYRVSSVADLQALSAYCNSGNDCRGRYWLLTQDIDLSGVSNFTPIGNASSVNQNILFKGNFDGGGYEIKNLTVNSPEFYMGLFGWVAMGTIRNLGVTNANVTGTLYVGAIAGMFLGNMSNCYTTGTVTGVVNIGGICGSVGSSGVGVDTPDVYGNITNCYSSAAVNEVTSGPAQNGGGIAGSIYRGTLKNCYTRGGITVSQRSGGLVGAVSNSEINNSYFLKEPGGVNASLQAFGESTGVNTVANVEERTASQMQTADFATTLNGSQNQTYWFSRSTVNDGYPAPFYQAGLCYITYSANGAMGSMPVQLAGSGLNVRLNTSAFIPATLQRMSHWKVVASSSSTCSVGDIITNNAILVVDGNITLEAIWENLSGDGSADNPYQLASVADLRALSAFVINNNCANLYFELTADIDMAGVTDYIPIGGSAANTANNPSFSFDGTFNGNGHTVRNLSVHMPDKQYVGLFGKTGAGSVIKNLSVVQATITGMGQTGILTGSNNGLISSCSVQGTVNSQGYAGTFAGECSYSGRIENCYAAGSVTSTGSYIGGMTGLHAGRLANCYSTSEVKGAVTKGGLSGYFYAYASITNSYFMQETDGINAGLSTTGQLVLGSIDSKSGPKTGADLKDAAMITTLNGNAGLPAWRADLASHVNNGYPILMWQGPVCTVQFKAGTGKGSMNDVMLPAGEAYKLNANSFSATGAALFQEWKVTASTVAGIAVGTVYTDQQEITPGTGILELTAQWKLAFTHGDGTAESPYLIQTPVDLVALNTYVSQSGNTTNVYWQLTTDLDMTGVQNFLPIGALEDSKFNGTLDGKGHKITNLTIQSSVPGVGLFLSVGRRGRVSNLGIGSGCSFLLNTTSDDVVFAGGIAATNMGIIGNCYSTMSMDVSNTGDLALGGIAGENQGSIINCYATGNLSGTIGEDAEINAIGGITGYNAGKVSSGYFTGSIITSAGTGTSNIAGGIVGYNMSLSGPDKIKSKSPGTVAGHISKAVAGDGGGSFEISIDNCYFLQEGSINQGLNGVGLGPDGGTARTSGQLKDAAMPGILNVTVYNHTWAADSNNSNNGYPVITLNGYQWDWTGDGTEQTPWMIGSGEQLDELRVYINAAGYPSTQHYWKLADNIDLNSFANFTPIGTTGAGNMFDGVFDGDGHVISNLKINQNSQGNKVTVGLFGYIGRSGIIKNMGIVSGSIQIQTQKSYCFAGAIAGYNGGSILNCFNRATIQVTNDYYNFIGGIAGLNEGTVSNCFNTGDITVGSPDASSYVGGIVGDNYGVVNYCYNTANISNAASEVVTGGVVGANDSGLMVTACYYLQEGSVNSSIDGIGDPASNNNATAQTSNGLRNTTMLAALNASQSPVPWKTDFNPNINNGYPILTWQTNITTALSASLSNELRLYPNPARDYMTVEGISGTVQIFHLSGRLVLSTQITGGKRINISALAKGIYSVKAGGKTIKLLKE